MSTTASSSIQGRGAASPRFAFLGAAAILAVLVVPNVRAYPRLVWSLAGVAAVLAVWALAVWWRASRSGFRFQTEFVAIRSHWVQACVQGSILAWWGWFVPAVPAHAPLILAQVFYLYAFDALLSWSRGRTWRAGFGPLPIIFSTNLLLWFKPDWFAFQFVMLTLGALGKNFVTWERDGRRTHIFNPSAFGQSIVAVVLIAFGLTKELTLGKEIAASFDTPHMLIVIFLGGLVVQYLFHVTLMTLAAAATLCLIDLAYHQVFGTYFFVNTNIAAPIFLGIHLLVTDPATSPKSNVGRVFFGSAYALGYAVLFRLFDLWEIPTFWDKLLPVPLLNLCVPAIDRLARAGFLGRIERAWQSAASPARLNLVHMGVWIALFSTWLATGFIEAKHPGDSIPFWKQALADGKPHAGHSLVMAVGSQAEANGSGAAYNELGLICYEGKLVDPNHPRAAEFFAKAAELGDPNGALNVVSQYLYDDERLSDEILARCFNRLETLCATGFQGPACWLLGRAHETGRGRPLDKRRALQFYMACPAGNPYAAKGIARIGLTFPVSPQLMARVAKDLENARAAGDAESAWYLAFMHFAGLGVERDDARARQLLEQACAQLSSKPCADLGGPALPPYAPPEELKVPPFSTAFPLP